MTDDDTITDPREMRKRLHDLGRTGMYDENGGVNATAALVRQCQILADREGFSGEDRMTFVAWYLMRAAERWAQQALDTAVNAPPPFLTVMWPKWQPMDTAPKDGRPILLRMPALYDAWGPGAWRGSWSASRDLWGLHLPLSYSDKSAAIHLDGRAQPTGWMELPRAE